MTPLRAAGKTERRCIMRQVLGYYRSLIVTALYTLPLSSDFSSGVSPETFFPALRHCISAHPVLSTTVSRAETESPWFVRPETLDLRNHVKIIDPATLKTASGAGHGDGHELELLKEVMIEDHNAPMPYSPTVPPWQIIVLPLSNSKCYITFSYSHSHGDGTSGLAFHKSLLQGLNNSSRPDSDPICIPPSTPLLPTLEEGGNLYISWSYMLRPFLATYLPIFISRPLNLNASLTPSAPDMWRNPPCSYDPETFSTGLEIVVISPEILDVVLGACKAHDAKLTGLLHQIVVRALSTVISKDEAGCFVAQTPINTRRLMKGFTNDDMAVCTTADYELFPRVEVRDGDEVVNAAAWTAASNTTKQLAERASTLVDQPVGLLQYLAHFRMWMLGQLGKQRDTSYELTNVLVFDPSSRTDRGKGWELGRTLISQPANALGSLLSFNVATRKGGEMVVTLTWQRGVLGGGDEDALVRRVGEEVQKGLSRVAEE